MFENFRFKKHLLGETVRIVLVKDLDLTSLVDGYGNFYNDLT